MSIDSNSDDNPAVDPPPAEAAALTARSLVHATDDIDAPRVEVIEKNETTPVAGKSSAWITRMEGSFYRVFGSFGPSMVAVFGVSALWTFVLAAIQVRPNEMANAIMNTTQFDNGQFWLLPEPEPSVVIASVVLLTLFGLGYLALALYMVSFLCRPNLPSCIRLSTKHTQAIICSTTEPSDQSRSRRAFEWLKTRLMSPTPLQRHYYNAVLDVPKLVFQTTTLFTYLRRGFPTPLIYFYSVLLLFNWLVSCYRYQCYLVDPRLVVARLFYMFDLFFAVFAPLVVLIYFIYDFEFDRAAFDIKQETMSAMNYDRIARLYGDPAQISNFASAFHHLQLSSGSSLYFKATLNLLSLYKWRKIVVTLVHCHRSTHHVQPSTTDQVSAKESKLAPASPTQATIQTISSHRAWPMRIAGAMFFLAGTAVFVYTIVAADSTSSLCAKYTRCGVASYQWNVGETYCTCLMFVDRQTAPRSFSEWEEPEDATARLAELAVAGELRIVQIINRALPEIPVELRRCRNLERIILIYTKTQHFPDWIRELSHLEYIHLEGDLTPRRLQALPDGMFDHLPHLIFLHLGVIVDVPRIPSLTKLHRLQYLVLVGLESMAALPSFEGLSELHTLLIADATHIPVLPSLAPLANIRTIALRFRNAVCCNGFLTGACDLAAFACHPRAGEPNVRCTSERISASDRAVLDDINAFYCPTDGSDDVDLAMIAPTRATTDDLCGGVLYKQCALGNMTGMCYNSRMQVVNCVVLPEYEAMRRLQIARGVGEPCNPVIESWLGCS